MLLLIFRDTVSSALQSICKAYPELAKEHLVLPMLAELSTDPSRAWLLVHLSPTPSLAASAVPALISILQSLLSNSPGCDGMSEQYWKKVFSISTALMNIVRSNAASAPLTQQSVNCLMLLSQQAAGTHWMCCSAQINRLMVDISTSFSYNAQHAADRWEWLVLVLSDG